MSAIDHILSLIGHYGYLVIFFGVMLESMGVPLPGETILLAAGVMVQRGHLDLGDAVAFGILGAVVGDQIGYWVGRGGGAAPGLFPPATGARQSSWPASSRA